MTQGEKKILKALGWGNPPIRSDKLRSAVKLTSAGMHQILRRMEDRRLVAITRSNGVFIELSFGGHRLKERLGL